ncbi:M48 family metalloprotease [Gardnerella greenwoodii]|uniref:M48 family metalloprotease n=1 Tax=Gardnerella greenwoodii TaxID=2914925 RepID=UPI0039EE7354
MENQYNNYEKSGQQQDEYAQQQAYVQQQNEYGQQQAYVQQQNDYAQQQTYAQYQQYNSYAQRTNILDFEKLAKYLYASMAGIMAFLCSASFLIVCGVLAIMMSIFGSSRVSEYQAEKDAQAYKWIILAIIAVIIFASARSAYRLYKSPIDKILEGLDTKIDFKDNAVRINSILDEVSAEIGIEKPHFYLLDELNDAVAFKDNSRSVLIVGSEIVKNCTDDELRAVIEHEMIRLSSPDCEQTTRIAAMMTMWYAYYEIGTLDNIRDLLRPKPFMKFNTKKHSVGLVFENTLTIAYQFIVVIVFRSVKWFRIPQRAVSLILSRMDSYYEYRIDEETVKKMGTALPLISCLNKTMRLTNNPSDNTYGRKNVNDTFWEAMVLFSFNPCYSNKRRDTNRLDVLYQKYSQDTQKVTNTNSQVDNNAQITSGIQQADSNN